MHVLYGATEPRNGRLVSFHDDDDDDDDDEMCRTQRYRERRRSSHNLFGRRLEKSESDARLQTTAEPPTSSATTFRPETAREALKKTFFRPKNRRKIAKFARALHCRSEYDSETIRLLAIKCSGIIFGS